MAHVALFSRASFEEGVGGAWAEITGRNLKSGHKKPTNPPVFRQKGLLKGTGVSMR